MSAPTVLNVPGFFEPTHKYGCSVAMVLDATDYDEADGDCSEWHSHMAVFYDVDVAQAYQIVSNYVETERTSSADVPTWDEARQMIDILAEGHNWQMITTDQGFVFAVPFPEKQSLVDIFAIFQELYSEASGDAEA